MKKYLLGVVFLIMAFLSGTLATAQPLRGEWLMGSGGEASVDLPWLNIYPDGSICQTGSFSGKTFTIGGVTLSLTGPSNELYVARLSRDGYPFWVTTINSSESNMNMNKVFMDPAGTVHILASFRGGTVSVGDLTLTDTVSGGYDESAFVAAVDADGSALSLMAPIPFDVENQYYVSDVLFQEDGSMVLVGNFWGDSIHVGDIVLHNNDPNNYSLFVFSFDPSGVPLWGRSVLMTSGGEWGQLEMMGAGVSNGEVTLAGTYMGDRRPIVGTDTLPQAMNSNILFLHYDNQGDLLWSKYSVGDAFVSFSQALGASTGDVYFTGSYQNGKIIFDSLTIENPLQNDYGFLGKITAAGEIAWMKNLPLEVGYGEIGYKGDAPNWSNSPTRIMLDKENNVYLNGGFGTDTLSLEGTDLIKFPDHAADQFIAKYAPDGTLAWAVSITSDNEESGDMTLDDQGRLYMCSPMYDTLRFEDGRTLGYVDTTAFTYVLELGPEGDVMNMTSLSGLTQNSYIYDVSIQAGISNEIFLSGRFGGGTITANGKDLFPAFADNIFMAKFSPLTLISGHVMDAGGEPVMNGYVLLYKLGESGVLPVVDSVPVMEGVYKFRNLLNDQYLLYAAADTLDYPDYIGTYYVQAASWAVADTVSLAADTLSDLDITLLQVPKPDGSGTLSGTITREEEGTAKSTASITGEPVKKIKVILIGTEKSSDNIVAWVYTDDDGHYVFRNIPDGSYRIIVDIPGLPQDSTYTVTISVDNNVISGLDFLVTKDEVKVAKASGIVVSPADLLHISVWPNPTMGQITVVLPEEGAGTVTLYDPQGRIAGQYIAPAGRKTLEMDLSGLPAGIYLLRVTHGRKTGISRVIIQH